ncbi:beta-agarase [Luteolibacter algae]|uniref:Beta-agarase n=1 Tax=Luteolibacter algae TaxID=454151 RepID=A0ABW5D6L1_9BACT
MFPYFKYLGTTLCPVVLIFSACKKTEAPLVEVKDNSIQIQVSPELTRSIDGISKLDRKRYFALADHGENLDKRVGSDERFDELTEDFDISLGRILGPVKGYVKNSKIVREDTARPGYVDLENLIRELEERRQPDSGKLKAIFGENMNIAAHDHHNAYPEFMGKYETPESAQEGSHAQYIPKDIEAAAELSARILKHGFTDFTRPAYYELVNEPHWSFFKDQHLADWHLATKRKVHELTPDVQVGGLCMSVAYFYKDYYKNWLGMKSFIDNTRGELDFYSFHVYDYYRNPEAGKNATRITSGLPLEGVLDLVNNYAVNTFGKELKLVVSEHGGYASKPGEDKMDYDGQFLADELYDSLVEEKKDGFTGEMERRSMIQWLHVSSILANTLTFMDRPQSVVKSVPFILANTEAWDPKYYASVYTPEEYEKGAELQASFLASFYKLFAGIEGRRVIADSPDPDLQVRAFADGKKVYTIVNNLSTVEHQITLSGLEGAKHEERRISRGKNMLPSYTVSEPETAKGIVLGSREVIVYISTFPEEVKEKSIIFEKVFYGDRITQKIDGENPVATIKVKVPDGGKALDSMLRIGIDRGVNSSYFVNVSMNHMPLNVPQEDSATRYDDSDDGYASTKLIPIPAGKLAKENNILISFPDGGDGAVGSAVIRARFSQPSVK